MANFSLRMLHGTELSVFFPLFRGEGGRTHVKIVCCKYYIILEAIWQFSFTLKGLFGKFYIFSQRFAHYFDYYKEISSSIFVWDVFGPTAKTHWLNASLEITHFSLVLKKDKMFKNEGEVKGRLNNSFKKKTDNLVP